MLWLFSAVLWWGLNSGSYSRKQNGANKANAALIVSWLSGTQQGDNLISLLAPVLIQTALHNYKIHIITYYLKGQECSKVNSKYLCLTCNQVSSLVHAGSFPSIWRLSWWPGLYFARGGCGEFKDKIYTLTYDLHTIKAPVGSVWFHLKGWEMFETLCCDLALHV